MSRLQEWIDKRPQLKKPVFWLAIVLGLSGVAGFWIFQQDFLLRSLCLLLIMAGAWIMIKSRKPR